MKKFERYFSILMWALIVVSIAILVWGFSVDFTQAAVDTLLRWAYVMVGIALFSVIVIGIIVAAGDNPKGLIKGAIGVVGIAAIVCVVYFLSSGSPAVGLTVDQPEAGTLKLTDTVLNLTYLAGTLAVLAIVAGEIASAIRNK
jgi:hypothetical protein